MTGHKSSQQLFIVGMVLSMTCWGLSWSSGKVLSAYADPLTISFIRFGFTVISLFAILLFMREKILIRRTGLQDLLIAAVLLSVYTYAFFQGLLKGKAGAGGVLVTVLNPIMAYGITIGLAKRKPTRNESLGLLLGFLAGIVLLKVFSTKSEIASAGNLYFLLAAMVWALLSRFTARANRYGSSVTFSFWLYTVSSLMLLALAGAAPVARVVTEGDSLFWVNVFFSSTITTALATTFYFVATARVGASKASSFIFLVPFSAAIGAWIFLGEAIELHTVAGGALGIGAVYVLNRKDG